MLVQMIFAHSFGPGAQMLKIPYFFFGAPYSVNLMFYFSNDYKKQTDITSKMLEQRRRKDIIVGIYR